jgi:very-short-patch-repair endonuclease
MELCGTYALRPDGIEGAASRDYALVDAKLFARHVKAWEGLRGLAAARKVARYLTNGSASVMETKLYLLLCLPQKYGGYNFMQPELNSRLAMTPSAREALRQKEVKPDMLWRDAKVVVEYDGAYHNDPRQSAHDALRKSILESMGYTVFTFKKWTVYNPLAFSEVADTLARKLGRRMRPLTAKQSFARDALREHLLGK